ncbi:FecR domain-containing protein [Sphingobacterium sp. BIGb0165]|uniref:FecR domain-containing protein n=1 Tax=Sphingobacterium sp. BIGb0165 TaxID=2940615 RepID=UPI00216927D5|nr:FecR domain-containing protein [Sphingobacterium sp. BIGb0165]MCS4224652.1 hypothetical protein [Sphingobacterium sp. BIGb0165]
MKDFFRLLFKNYNQDSLLRQERAVVDQWYQKHVDDLKEAPNEEQAQKEIWKQLMVRIKPEPKVRSLQIWKWAAAAIFFVVLGIGTYSIINDKPEPLNIAMIQPASRHALLSIDGGKEELEIHDLTTATLGGNADKIENIQITAPKGASFDLTLPDGTKVFLNSDSKINYPRKFTGNMRQVRLEGEAYFEVAHNKEKPFIVKTGTTEIKVLGTKFNVRAYPNMEDNLVSLLEGSVQLSNQFSSMLLKPGEMAVIQRNAQNIPVKDIADADPIAWKSGYFNFNNIPVSEMALEIGRWYNVEFDLSYLKKDIRLTGRIRRDNKLKTLLALLSSTDELYFETKDQHIVIKNN